MMARTNRSGRATSMTSGLMAGIVANLIITFAASMILAKMIDAEKMSWDQVGYGIIATLLVASFSGAWVSCYRIKHRRLMVCGLSALLYSILLLAITTLFYGGRYEGVLVSILLIFAGSMAAFLLTTPKSRPNRHNKYRTATR